MAINNITTEQNKRFAEGILQKEFNKALKKLRVEFTASLPDMMSVHLAQPHEYPTDRIAARMLTAFKDELRTIEDEIKTLAMRNRKASRSISRHLDSLMSRSINTAS